MVKRQVIRLKKSDLDKAIVRGLGRSAWEHKKSSPLQGKTHASKRSRSRYKERFDEEGN